MKHIPRSKRLFVDVRAYDRPDTLSYDLSQHLPRRLAVGSVLVLADNPPVFLSVLRKRLAKLLYDVERERARTLDHIKRLGLNREVLRLRSARFSTKPTTPVPDVLCTAPYIAASLEPSWQTIYVAAHVTDDQLQVALGLLRPGGLLVVYGEWPPAYEAILANHQML